MYGWGGGAKKSKLKLKPVIVYTRHGIISNLNVINEQ